MIISTAAPRPLFPSVFGFIFILSFVLWHILFGVGLAAAIKLNFTFPDASTRPSLRRGVSAQLLESGRAALRPQTRIASVSVKLSPIGALIQSSARFGGFNQSR